VSFFILQTCNTKKNPYFEIVHFFVLQVPKNQTMNSLKNQSSTFASPTKFIFCSHNFFKESIFWSCEFRRPKNGLLERKTNKISIFKDMVWSCKLARPKNQLLENNSNKINLFFASP
jgi:hypothetical protein